MNISTSLEQLSLMPIRTALYRSRSLLGQIEALLRSWFGTDSFVFPRETGMRGIKISDINPSLHLHNVSKETPR